LSGDTHASELAIFTILKPANNPHIELIQRNAVQSWLALGEGVEILLFGDEGTTGFARSLGVRHDTEFAYSEHGAPLLNSVFARAEALTASPLMAYVNADILLLNDFELAAKRIARARPRFLMAGSRWDLDVEEPLVLEGDWQSALRARVAKDGQPHPPAGSDYFVYPRGFWGELPPFALGRSSFDNWLLYRARTTAAAVVDASSRVLAVHQNHDYGHIGGVGATWSGPDAQRNFALAGGDLGISLLTDASHVLKALGVFPSVVSPHHLARRIRRITPALRSLLRRSPS
jgi:hypothetical protein